MGYNFEHIRKPHQGGVSLWDGSCNPKIIIISFSISLLSDVKFILIKNTKANRFEI